MTLHTGPAVTTFTVKSWRDCPNRPRGFCLLTEAGEVVDLSTDFAVNISADHSKVVAPSSLLAF
jgi:hypothetical protein